MIELNNQQISQIENILAEKGLHYEPLKEELLDHLCCHTEAAMASGLPFDKALQSGLNTFQEDEIKDLQVQTLLLLNQNQSFIMKVSIAALITFLVVCSATWLYNQEPPSMSPLKGNFTITSGFGPRMHPIQKVKKKHKGVDFKAPLGTPVYATSDGVVVKSEFHKGYGNHIIVQHDEHFKTLYAQLSEMNVKTGEKVKKGELIGKVGSSGRSTAPHLHYEVIKDGMHEDPEDYLKP